MSSLVVAAIGIGGGVGLAGLAYRVIRPGFPVRVNCWFCQEWTSVPFGNRDCWDCPACEQYNGFDKDGGYNKDIPAQHRADLNHLTCDPSAVGQPSPSTSHLCDSCNRNQLLRVKQLAAFVPFNERNYDAEVSAYERHLEQVYRLCSLCATSTKYELKRQDRLLRTRMRPDERDRLQKSSQSALCTSHHDSENFASQRPLFSKAINVLSLLCAAWLLFVFLFSIQTAEVFKGNNLFPLLCAFRGHQPDSFTVSAVIFTGMFLDIFSKLVLGKVRIYLVDGLGCVSWLALLFCHLLRLQNPHNQSVLPMLIICAVTTGVEFFSLLQNRQPRSNPNISIRRLSLDSQNLNDSTSSRVTSSFTQNSSKLSDVTASASKTKYSQVTREATDKFPWQEQFPWNRLQGPNLPGNGVPQRSAVAPSLFSEPVRRETTLGHQNESFALNSSFLSTLSEPLHDTKGFAAGLRHSSNSLFRLVGQKPSAEDRTFTTENLHHDLDLELDSINLGTTSMSNSSGIFSGYASVHTGEGRGDRLHSLRQRRPLISPAKLDTSRLSTSTPTGPGLFRRSAEQQRETDRTSRQSLFNLSVSDPWHGAELRRLSSSSNQDFRSSSVIGGGDQRAFCPVDSTTDNPSTKACPGPLDAGYGRLMTGVWAVLGFSVATNLTVLYLTLSKS